MGGWHEAGVGGAAERLYAAHNDAYYGGYDVELCGGVGVVGAYAYADPDEDNNKQDGEVAEFVGELCHEVGTGYGY